MSPASLLLRYIFFHPASFYDFSITICFFFTCSRLDQFLLINQPLSYLVIKLLPSFCTNVTSLYPPASTLTVQFCIHFFPFNQMFHPVYVLTYIHFIYLFIILYIFCSGISVHNFAPAFSFFLKMAGGAFRLFRAAIPSFSPSCMSPFLLYKFWCFNSLFFPSSIFYFYPFHLKLICSEQCSRRRWCMLGTSRPTMCRLLVRFISGIRNHPIVIFHPSYIV